MEPENWNIWECYVKMLGRKDKMVKFCHKTIAVISCLGIYFGEHFIVIASVTMYLSFKYGLVLFKCFIAIKS